MESEYQQFVQEVLWQAKRLGAEYADCRLCPEQESEEIKLENGQITALNSSRSAGFGVRLLMNGSWGFYGSPILKKENIETVVRRAIHSASINSSFQKEKVFLVPRAELWEKEKVGIYQTRIEIDPFAVSLDEKLKLLTSADEAIVQTSKKVFWRIGEIAILKTRKLFACSEGVRTDQTIIECGASLQAHAIAQQGGDIQRRSWPDSHFYYMQGGYEYIKKLELVENAAKIAKEAEQLLEAPRAPSGNRGIILLQSMLNLHSHETVHGFEADRTLGSEWTLAGGSFLTPLLSEIGKFRFGSEKVNIRADSTLEGGVGTFGYDDEGTPAQRMPLVTNGVWVGLLTSRETVPLLNQKIGREYFKQPSGAVRTESYGDWPVIRMTNIIVEPGETDFEDLKDSVPNGTILFGTNKSWSIDDVRRHFTFGTEIAFEKVNGKWEIRKNAKYYGDNLNFWRNCQIVCDEKSFQLQGVGSCGKADPLQVVHTGHGASPAYFSNIRVGAVG
ncbi:MAG: TldD/PmbA family protein [Patescibacteria group bacterium]